MNTRYYSSLRLVVALLLLVLAASIISPTSAQHFCFPCAKSGGLVGKYTYAAEHPEECYDWIMRYLNNVIPGSNNTGIGTKAYPLNGTILGKSVANLTKGLTSEILEHDFWYNKENAYPGWPEAVLLPDYESPNVVGSELNDFYTLDGMLQMAPPFPPELSEANKTAYEQAGLRLPIQNRQAPCARTGRATIIKATTSKTSTELQNYSQFDGIWDADYIDAMQEIGDARSDGPAEQDSSLLFGIHNIGCMYHSSGPCKRKDIERTIKSGWSGNFSSGYVPMMDNNLMLWTPTLRPLLDAFFRDDIHFYPMRWDNGDGTEIYSVLVNPCGLTLIEIASNDIGGADVSATDFHLMPHKRAVLENSTIHTKDYRNEPLPLVPIRISRAVGTDEELMDKMLQFYGANKEDVSISSNIGFDTTVLLDEPVDQDRAVTLMLSESATVHLQLWSRNEIDDSTVDFLDTETFAAAVGSNQINGGQPENAQSFCTEDVVWTVDRYNKYVVKTHESTMAPSTTEDGEPYDPTTPPAGGPIDTWIDIHFSWTCTDPSCSIQKGLQGFYDSGARAFNLATPGIYRAFAYGYDPSGYGVELQFVNTTGVNTTGVPFLSCWQALSNGICPFAFDNSTADDDDTVAVAVAVAVVSTTDPPVPEETMVVSVPPTDSPQDNVAVSTTAPTTNEPIPSSSTSNFGTLFLLATTTTYSVFLAAVLSFA